MQGLIYLSFILAGCLADDLVTLSLRRVTGSSQCCGGEHILSCNLANVQIENLGTDEINLPGSLTLDFLNNINDNPNAYHYGSNDGEAVITYNPNSNGLHGHALSADGKSYVIEFCGSSGHVWKLLDTNNMPGDHGIELPTNRLALQLPSMESEPNFSGLQLSLSEPEPEFALPELNFGASEPEMLFPTLTLVNSEPESPSLTLESSEPESPTFGSSEAEFPPLSLGGGSNPETYKFPEYTLTDNEELTPLVMPSAEGEIVSEIVAVDNTTSVTYSVKFYYTADVAADTADLDGFFDQIIAETNVGYDNSGIPLQIAKHCAEQTSITESGKSFEDLLLAITNSNPAYATTRDGADVVALIVLNGNYCGLAWTNVLANGATFSVTKKSCATGYYSFGHEIAHNIGAMHDPATSTNNDYSYAHGHLIAQGNANTGARTIMAYSASGHEIRVNYWSNPAISHPITGTPTGVVGLSNNAALLIAKRYTLAAIGDESFGNCKVATTTAPVTAAPVTTMPVVAPVTTMPVVAPVTTMPVVAPVTTIPVVAPVTTMPVVAPVTTMPVVAPVTTMPVVAPVTTMPVVAPVTTMPVVAPVTTMPVVAPVTTIPVVAPVTTMPVVAPVTTMPVVAPVTTIPVVAPVTTMPVVAPVTTMPVVAPVTTMPVVAPVTTMPVVAPVTKVCKKEAKALGTMKRIKKVKTGKLCQKKCQDAKGCIAFNHFKKTKTCQLLKLKTKKAGNQVCTGTLDASEKPGAIKCNKQTTNKIGTIKKFKMTALMTVDNNYCQKKCQESSIKGCVAFNEDTKKKTCQLLKLVNKKKKGICTGTPNKL